MTRLTPERLAEIRAWAAEAHTPPTEYRRNMRLLFAEIDALRMERDAARALVGAMLDASIGAADIDGDRAIDAAVEARAGWGQ